MKNTIILSTVYWLKFCEIFKWIRKSSNNVKYIILLKIVYTDGGWNYNWTESLQGTLRIQISLVLCNIRISISQRNVMKLLKYIVIIISKALTTM